MTFSIDTNRTTLIDQRAINSSEPQNVLNLGNISGTATINMQLGVYFKATVTGNVTISISNPPASGLGGGFILYLINGGNYEITWPDAVVWSCGLEPDFTETGMDILTFITIDIGTTWIACLSARDVG